MDDRLDMRLKATTTDTVHRVAPWRPDIAWWVVGLEGIVAVLLGLWLLVNQGAGEPVVAVLGVVLIALSVAWGWSAMRSDLPQVVLGWRGMRAGAGLAVGIIVALDFLSDYLSAPAALVMLCIGLLMVGVMGTVEWFTGRERMGWRWPSLAGPALAAAFGLIVLLSRLQAAPIFLQVIAAASLILGVLLLVRAALLFRAERVLRAMPAPAEGSSVPTPIPQASAGAVAPPITVRSAGSAKPPDATPPGGGGPGGGAQAGGGAQGGGGTPGASASPGG